MMFLVELKIDFDSKKDALTFFKSIQPKLKEFSQSETKIAQKDKVLEVRITASDKASMRASYNTVIKPLILFNKLEGVL